ncbi:MAG: heme NO-binding domain-containing protein [Acidobacteriota bacterium]
MLGIVFSEFIEMVEVTFSEEVADEMIEEVEKDLASGGSYTAVGNYDHVEMLTLVTKLSEITKVPIPQLVEAYGKHLFGRFHTRYPAFFEGIDNSFDFLQGIEDRIHSEVRKLYPNSELPGFDLPDSGTERMVMDYSSSRPFAPLAFGLIQGCIEHFGEAVEVDWQDLSNGEGTKARFVLSRAA